MSCRYYSEINLHITWHTKLDAPMLADSNVESLTHRTLEKLVRETPRAFVHEIEGTDDHVHLAVTVPPTIGPSQWIGQLKGQSSHDVNQARILQHRALQWQAGYGIVSFGTRDLEWVKAYVRNQREHHRNGGTVERLERIVGMDDV